MESTIDGNSDGKIISEIIANVKYKCELRKQLNDEVKKIIDVEMQKAVLEIGQEYKKATRQSIDDYKSAVHLVVEEEKVEIWRKAETLKKTTLHFGL